jgi:hypothetical protein
MQNKIIIRIDLTKLDKSRIVERTYKNRDGVEVISKDYEFEIVPLNPAQQTFIAEGNDWKLLKTHFVTDSATKEERQVNKKMKTIGDGKQFMRNNNIEKNTTEPQSEEDIPFM